MTQQIWRFLSAQGRFTRKPYWFGNVLLIPSFLVFENLSLRLGNGLLLSALLAFNFAAIIALPHSIMRLHDRGRRGWWVMLPLSSCVVYAVSVLYALKTLNPSSSAAELSFLIWFALFLIVLLLLNLWLMVELCFLRGDHGPNRYGEDPLDASSLEDAAKAPVGSSMHKHHESTPEPAQ